MSDLLKKSSDLLKKTSVSLIFGEQPEPFAHLLIFGEQPEQFTHGRSFLVSNLSDSLTLLIFGERPE